MKTQWVKKTALIVLLGALALWALLAIVFFLGQLSNIEQQSSARALQVDSENNAAVVRDTFDKYIASSKALVTAIEQHDDFSSHQVIDLIGKVAKNEGYERMAIDFANGMSYTSEGYIIDVSGFGQTTHISNGETMIVDVTKSLIDGAAIINTFVPITTKQGKHIAALRCAITTKQLSEDFDKNFSSANGYFRIVDSKGDNVAVSTEENQKLADENYFDSLDLLNYEPGYSKSAVMEDFANLNSGYIQYSYNDKESYAYYTPVGINGWMIIDIAPKEAVVAQQNRHTQNAMLLMLQIIVILLAVALYIYISQKKAQKKILLNESYFKALAENSGKEVYDWEIPSGKLSMLAGRGRLFTNEQDEALTIDSGLQQREIYPDDIDKFIKMYGLAMTGNNFNDIRIRIKDADGEYRWCGISGVSIKDKHGKALRTIAFFEDIDEQMQKELRLSEAAEQDLLTGLYNKSTTEMLIKEALADRRGENTKHALLIADADNFKSINDSFGHKYGDDVLRELAAKLKPLFRTNDIIGRIGGDEFFVFIRNYGDISLVTSKAKELVAAFDYVYRQGETEVHVTASVGVATCPEHGADFETLYKNADTALYLTKEHGKNGYTLYDGVSKANYKSTRTAIDSDSI